MAAPGELPLVGSIGAGGAIDIGSPDVAGLPAEDWRAIAQRKALEAMAQQEPRPTLQTAGNPFAPGLTVGSAQGQADPFGIAAAGAANLAQAAPVDAGALAAQAPAALAAAAGRPMPSATPGTAVPSVSALTPSYAPSIPSAPVAAPPSAIPGELQPTFGTLYPSDYDAKLDAAVASGRITQAQADTMRAARERAAMTTPEGLQQRGIEQAVLGERERLGLTQEQAQKQLGLEMQTVDLLKQTEADKAEEYRRFDEERQKIAADNEKTRQDIATANAEAAAKIDPNNYWANKSGWQKALSLLSVAIGGFVQGYSRGQLPNTALAMINDEIARDIDAQKANIATKRAKVGELQNLYAIGRQRLGDEQSAYQWATARLNERVADAAGRLAQEGRTDQIRQAAAMAEQHYREQQRKADLDVQTIHLNAAIERRRQAMAAAAGQAAAMERAEDRRLARLKTEAETGKLTAETARTLAEAGKAQAEGGIPLEGGFMRSERLESRYVPQLGALAATPEEAKELKEKGAMRDNLVQNMDRIIKILNDDPTTSRIPGTEANAKLKGAQSDLMFKTGKMYGAGALSEREAENIQGIYGTSNYFNRLEVLKGQRGEVEKNYANIAQQASLTPVEVQRTARGNAFRIAEQAQPVAPPVTFKPAR